MKATDILKAAAGHMEDRAQSYDKPDGERSMGKTVAAFNALTGHKLTEEQGWLLLGLLKMARSQQGKFRADNYEDEAAYAALRGECAARERGLALSKFRDVEPWPEDNGLHPQRGLAPADDAGWIEWGGGPRRPVGANVGVEVKLRNGARQYSMDSDLFWGRVGSDVDIIAYRVLK